MGEEKTVEILFTILLALILSVVAFKSVPFALVIFLLISCGLCVAGVLSYILEQNCRKVIYIKYNKNAGKDLEVVKIIKYAYLLIIFLVVVTDNVPLKGYTDLNVALWWIVPTIIILLSLLGLLIYTKLETKFVNKLKKSIKAKDFHVFTEAERLDLIIALYICRRNELFAFRKRSLSADKLLEIKENIILNSDVSKKDWSNLQIFFC